MDIYNIVGIIFHHDSADLCSYMAHHANLKCNDCHLIYVFVTFAISSANFVFIIQQLVSGESDMNLRLSLLQLKAIHVSLVCIFICFKTGAG